MHVGVAYFTSVCVNAGLVAEALKSIIATFLLIGWLSITCITVIPISKKIPQIPENTNILSFAEILAIFRKHIPNKRHVTELPVECWHSTLRILNSTVQYAIRYYANEKNKSILRILVVNNSAFC